MKNKKVIVLIALVVVTIIGLIVYNNINNKKQEALNKGLTTVKIGVSPVPHEDIAKIAKEKLKGEGINLEIVVFDDYVQPNLALNSKDLDLNFFQHKPYLEQFNKENKTDIVSLGGVHIEPIALYSTKIKNLSELKDGSEIIIPNDATNGSRALKLLSDNKIIELKKGVELPTVKDIEKNPKNIKITELEAALIPGSYKDVDAAVINSNYAISAKLNPLKDSLAIESKDSIYSNIIAVKKEKENDKILKKVYEAFTSNEVKKFIEDKYQGQIIPSFDK